MRATFYFLIAAALAAAGWFWIWKPEPTPTNTSAPASSSTSAPSSGATTPTHSILTSESPAPNSPDYGKLLRESTDILSLVETLLPRATEGDPAAQYWLSRALPICDEEYDSTFQNIKSEWQEEVTLDQALQQYATDRSKDPDELRALYAKCQNIRETGFRKFRDWRDWLEASAKGGYPLGQVSLASEFALLYHDSTTANGKLKLQEMRQLAIEALRHGDPEIVMDAANIPFFLGMAADQAAAERSRRSWMLAACMRGADCSPQADWVRSWCRVDLACQPFETGSDMIRRYTGPQYEELASRAREINALIDANAWDKLEFE